MSKLTTKQRKALSSSEFALPAQRAYPLDTRARAANAKARAAQFATPAEKAIIDRKANAVLGKTSKSTPKGRKKAS